MIQDLQWDGVYDFVISIHLFIHLHLFFGNSISRIFFLFLWGICATKTHVHLSIVDSQSDGHLVSETFQLIFKWIANCLARLTP